MSPPRAALTALLACLLACRAADGFAFGTATPVSALVAENADRIASLRAEAESVSGSDAPNGDVFYLRYCLAPFEGGDDEMRSRLAENMRWRAGSGKAICDAARAAVGGATSAGGWNNDPVRAAAPHASVVNEFITPSQAVTTTSRRGDLVYCIRAGKIDDVALMSKISVEDMTEFFLYTKEVNAAVADARSASSDRLVCVVTANDLSGLKLVGGDATFRKALSAASNKASELYPSLAGPTLLLNLPRIAAALVKLFTPLFSKDVRRRLKFERGPLGDVEDLTDILGGPEREKFLDAVDELIYADL